jgi:asparagine synthase (glutamine-hydrolysing)
MEPFEAMTLWDIENYLPGDNLVKVDRASMAVSLEMRAPLLDHRVCELARGVIQAFGYDAFRASPKWPLRQLAYRYVPRRLLDRPKMGFSVPMSRWLREGLKPWGDGLVAGAAPALFDDRLRHTLSEAWVAHQNRSADHADTLWPLLVFLQWADRLPQSMSQPVLNS